MVVNGEPPLRRRGGRRRRRQPGADHLLERRRARPGLPLRGLAQRRKLPAKPPARAPQDYKQIVVAVKLDTPGSQPGERGYVEVQSNVVDPQDSAEKDPAPGANGVVTAQQFFLTDTPCSASGDNHPRRNHRRPPAAQHARHLRQRACRTGPRPARPTPCCSAARPTPPPKTKPTRCSTTTPTTSTSSRRPTPTRACRSAATTPAAATTRRPGRPTPRRRSIAGSPTRWPPNFKMSGKVTLEFYTRTLNDALYHGTLCVYLFDRHETGTANRKRPTRCWPTKQRRRPTGPTRRRETDSGRETHGPKVRLTMTFNGAPNTIPAGDRLGVALSVDPATPTPTRSRSCTTTRTTRPGSRSTRPPRSKGASGGRRRGDRLPRRADRRQLRDRRRPPGAARRIDRRAALALPRAAAPRSPPTTTSRSSPGCCCAGGRAAAARRSRPATR